MYQSFIRLLCCALALFYQVCRGSEHICLTIKRFPHFAASSNLTALDKRLAARFSLTVHQAREA